MADAAQANDPDGVADRLGADAAITVGATTGLQYIWVGVIGHQSGNGKGTKGYELARIAVDVQASGNATPAVTGGTLAQYKSDTTTAIAQNGYTNETTVVFEAELSDTDNGDTVSLEVEYADSSGAFTGTKSTCTEGSFLSDGATATTVQTTCAGLTNGTSYMWRVRANDGSAQSAWVEYGPVAADTDVTIDTTAPTLTSTDPSDTQTDVPLDQNVTITFSEANLDCATVTTTNITSAMPGWSLSSCTEGTGVAVFTSTGQTNNTGYSFTITSNVSDKAGNTYAGPTTINYTTVAAAVTPPDTAITAPIASAVLNGASFNITGTATAGTNPLQDVLVSTDGGVTYPNTATGTASWGWSWTLPSEDYVAHTIMAKARDNQGTPLEDPSPAIVAIFVDTVAPTGLSLNTPADAATGVSTSPSLTVNAATDNNPTVEYQFEVAEDSGFSVNAQTSSWQAATNWTPPVALSAGTLHYWRATARDGAGNTASATGARTFTTSASCVYSPPTVQILTASKEITTDGGFTDYTLQVTNNDSAVCGNTTFNLSLIDTNNSNFYASVLAQSSLANLAPGASAQTTFRVAALANQPNSVSNDTDVTASDPVNHSGQSTTSSPITTTINVSGGGCVANGNYINTNSDQLITSRR